MAEQQKQCPRQVSRTPRSREDLVSTTWKMQETKATIDLINNPRMDVIRTQAEKEWEGGNDCQWLKCAVQELTRNRVHPIVFAEALRDLMIDGREKNPKIFIAGPTNYGKLFWFPHCKTYLKRSVIQAIDLAGCWKGWTEFSRRFRWSPEMIHSPVNTYAYDITIKTDTPIVTTSESEIKYIKINHWPSRRWNDVNQSIRWKPPKFHHQILLAKQKYIAPCFTCFCKLALLGELWISTSLFLMIWAFSVHATTHNKIRNNAFY